MGNLYGQSICIVIPAYNEATVVGAVIKELSKSLASHPLDFQVVLVDDGSHDDTSKVAEKSGAFVIQHILNTGSGGATATGLSYAQQNKFDYAATLDADGQHDAVDLARGIQLIIDHDYDLLIGSRLMDADGMSKVKVLGNKGLSLITYLLFGVKVTDSQSGLRLFSKRALDQLKWKTSGYEFCSEMLWRAKQQNLIVREFPIKAIYTEYSKGKGQNNWNAFHIITRLVRARILETFGE